MTFEDRDRWARLARLKEVKDMRARYGHINPLYDGKETHPNARPSLTPTPPAATERTDE